MFKILPHTYSVVKKNLVLLSIIFLSVNVFAQDDNDSITDPDTTLVTDSIYEPGADDISPKFDSLTSFTIPSYNSLEIHDSVLQNLKKDEAFWYANKLPKRQKRAEIDPNKKYSEPFYLQNWFRTLLWIFITAAFVAVVIWFLIVSDVRLFRKKAVSISSEQDTALIEDIFSINYEQELEKAIADENYRLGVRLMYLHILRLFSERDIIHYKIERTNSDYLMQLYNTSYYKDFFRLTRNFEYVWYGKFDISSAAFELIRKDHAKLKSLLLKNISSVLCLV